MTPEPGSGGSPLWIGVALVFVGMVTKDLFTSTEAQGSVRQKENAVSQEELAGNTIHFQYCYS